MITHNPLPELAGFYIPWLAAAAAAVHVPALPAGAPDVLTIDIGGVTAPVVQLVLAVAGVLLARPIAPRRNPPLGFLRSIIVTVIMLLAAVTWVAEARPGPLFAFVVSVGLGFSGYALIELIGREIEAFVKRIFAAAIGAIDNIGKPKK